MPNVAPCDWPLASCGETSTGEDVCSALGALSSGMAEAVISAATEFLWNATGQRFGLCPVTVRPCDPGCYDQSTYMGWSGIPRAYGTGNGWEPYIFNGNWFNMVCGGCKTGCSHQNLSKIKLPAVVNSVVEVTVDGAVFNDWEWNRNYGLIRTDDLHWPKSQDMRLPLTDVDTFGVTYLQGLPVPPGGQVAAGVLACEIAKQACGDGSCRLPKRVSTITREGVTVAFQDDFSMLQGGKAGPLTGIWVIDQWIATVNYSARRRSRILTPDAKPTWVV